MNNTQARCPYCDTLLEPIRLLEVPTPDVFRHSIHQVDPACVVADARPGPLPLRHFSLGPVRGMICRKCWRYQIRA